MKCNDLVEALTVMIESNVNYRRLYDTIIINRGDGESFYLYLTDKGISSQRELLELMTINNSSIEKLTLWDTMNLITRDLFLILNIKTGKELCPLIYDFIRINTLANPSVEHDNINEYLSDRLVDSPWAFVQVLMESVYIK